MLDMQVCVNRSCLYAKTVQLHMAGKHPRPNIMSVSPQGLAAQQSVFDKLMIEGIAYSDSRKVERFRMEAKYEILESTDGRFAVGIRHISGQREYIPVLGNIEELPHLVELCNFLALSPVHIRDVIEDFGYITE